jgi:hypothetical protein
MVIHTDALKIMGFQDSTRETFFSMLTDKLLAWISKVMGVHSDKNVYVYVLLILSNAHK